MTVAFGDWLIGAWQVDTETNEGQGFVRIECQCVNDILISLRERPLRPGFIVARLRKMYSELMAYRAAVGSGDADRNVDAVLVFLRTAAVDLVRS